MLQMELVLNADSISTITRKNWGRMERGLWKCLVFDASSKVPSGIAGGNAADLGSFEECINIKQRVNSSDFIRGRYCYGSTPLNYNEIASTNATFRLQVASCLPDTCSSNDVSAIYNYFGLNATFPEPLCQTASVHEVLRFGVAEYCGIAFFAIFALITSASTIYDVYLHNSHQLSNTKSWYETLVAFSILKNGRKLLAIEHNAKQITCINGIRVISTLWIILYHTFSIHFYSPAMNSFYRDKWRQSPGSMFLFNAPIAVDTFLLLSGIVTSYARLWSAEKDRPFQLVKFYLHRFLRLTPVLAAEIVFVVTLLRQFSSGPLWTHIIDTQLIEACQEYWWKTLLYVQNYGQVPSLCLPHGWYLGVDMQLFVISPIFLLPLPKWPKRTICGVVALIACNIIGCFALGWFLELNGIIEGNVDHKSLIYAWQYYYPAYTRAAPWLIGIVLGYYLYLSNKKKHTLPKKIVACVWILSLLVMFAIAFGGHGLMTSEGQRAINSIYIALARPVWALAVGVVIFSCANGYGRSVNWFLSLPAFEVLSRLTYSLFIVHYIVIYVLCSQMWTSGRKVEVMVQFWGHFACTLFIATFVTLVFELPVTEIEKIIFTKRKSEAQEGVLSNNSLAPSTIMNNCTVTVTGSL
ncbi:nose resistant to fluoxetine protein 6-like isoform X2 [Photinus pyralis]|uniref:nose resistant to fluoxetine protein 6-like isoform X2 n=1 Tax=Photinus pyralis TaxID=7054 RepID=UPI0012670AAF|nr:nose resistant to fluoxetine protein 6-like isoform X2 [Photinus pyralis]